jgi:DNA-binding response OmpR family regulator
VISPNTAGNGVGTVLALDDDRLQLELITFLLRQEEHRVHAATDPQMAYNLLATKVIDLIVMETALQHEDGFRVCQQIRTLQPFTPLMILSQRSEESEIVRGLLIAADDYMTKPFTPRLFLARVHALLRRGRVNRAQMYEQDLTIDEIRLDLHAMHVEVNGRPVRLTPRELSLLRTLMENPTRVLSREQLIDLAWGPHFIGTARMVDVYVQRVRKKIQPHITAGYIHAHRGFGYKFEAPRAIPTVA